MGDMTGTYRALVEKPEGRRSVGGRRCRWEDNIKMDLQEVGWEGGGFGGMDWKILAQDRDGWQARVNTVLNLRVP
jgi:hypothetical protein